MFKKVKFNLADGNCISTMEGNDVSLEEAIRILNSENVISATFTRMSQKEYFNSMTKKKTLKS